MTVDQHNTKTRLSEAVIWDLQEEYYKNLGIAAWDVCPYLTTSNTYIAEAYAEQVVAFFQDYVEHLDFSEPLYIVELGSGTGCFSSNFIHALVSKLSYFQKLKPLKWVYVITDIVPKNLEYWEKNAAFSDYITAGNVEFALFNPQHDETLNLRFSGKNLAAGDFKNPIIVVANYFFDSLRNDEFRVGHGVLEEVLVHFQSDPNHKFAFADFKKSTSYHGISTPYYNHFELDAILEEYRGLFEEASILFPVSALRTLDNLKRLSGNRLVVLSGDKGFTYPQYMQGHWEQVYTAHGSFSYMVNYDAMRRYFVMNDGDMLCTADPDLYIHLNVGYLLEGFKGTLESTRYYFEEKIKKQNISNYLPILLRDKPPAQNADQYFIKEFRAAIQLANFDAVLFDSYAQKLFDYLNKNSPSPYVKADLLNILERVEAGCYPMLGSGAPVWLGIMYYILQEYPRCISILEKSLVLFGENYYAHYYIALCYVMHFNQPAKALTHLNDALKLKPDDENTKEAIKRIRQSLPQNTGA